MPKEKNEQKKETVPKDPNERVFRNLTESAFEFLERSIGEFQESPKFSTIHFATAVELFLKARLMREHWSLTMESPDKAVLSEFRKGQSKTATQSATILRLRNIANVTISKEAVEAFNVVADHRNKMIHFVHEDDKTGGSVRTLEKIAMEQCRGWLHIERLLSEWRDHFEWCADRTAKVRQAMKGHRHFLSAIYERVEKEITGKAKGGIIFVSCHSCGHKAAEAHPVSDQLADLICLVCETRDTLVTIECPNCEGMVEITAYEGMPAVCLACSTIIDSDILAKELDTDDREYYEHVDKNCAICSGYHSVVLHYNSYVCTECFETSEEIAHCGWCSEAQMGGGDLEMSSMIGCDFCDGSSSWHKDD